MNLRKFLERRQLGRVLHRILVSVLLVSLLDMNQQTVFGMPVSWVRALQVEAEPLTAEPNQGTGLTGLEWGTTAGAPRASQRVLQLAQAVPGVAGQPDALACFGLTARAKGTKIQLVWQPVAGTTTYEVYRGSDTATVEFFRVGQVAGNSTTFLDSPLASEQTVLYFVRAMGPGLACDSTVAAGHPSQLRGVRNHPPVIYSIPPASGRAGVELLHQILAVDPDAGDSVLYGLIEGPVGMLVEESTGHLRWVATPGVHSVTVAAIDGGGATDLQSFTLAVDEPAVEVPDVVGLDEAAAEAAITGAGLVLGVVTGANSDLVPVGVVISQDPAGGESVAPGSVVDLVVSLGPTPVLVPNVVGLSEAAAEAAIVGAGLTVGAVTTANHPTVPAGEVISQNPVAGASVVLGSSVALVVSLGPVLVTVPDVVGLTQAAAEAAIVGAGLTVGGVTTANHPTVPAGDVISQDPVGGTSVAPGSSVALVVSAGPAPVEVPDVVGLDEAAAEAAITGAGLVLGVVTGANSDLVPVGVVISQDPAGGESVAPGSAVDLVVSLGPTPVLVPNVVGLSEAAAGAAITGAGLTVGAVTTANHPTVPAGDVISQDPVGGTSVAPGSSVALVVSLGPVLVTVPDVVGLTQAAAEAAIVGAGLTVGAVTTANHPTISAGEVISQNPVAGASVVLGSSVALVVSAGPAPVEVPDVVGLDEAAAEAAITGAGLVLGVVTGANSDLVPVGVVISQDPAGGESVAPGSAVDLVVSLGPTPVLVPNVVGLSEVAAEAAIVGAGLTVGAVTTANHPTVPAGDVISQDPVGGTSVAPGSSVALVVSLGPVLVAVPDVVGLTQAAAEAAIVGAGLTVGAVATANHPTIPAGEVISQNPVAGASVAPATSVALTISLGAGEPALILVEVTPANLELVAGQTRQYTAMGTWSDGHQEDITSTVTWLSTEFAVASVTAGGLATALDSGSTAIQATRDGVTGDTSLTVNPAELVSIQVTPDVHSLLVGQSQLFTASGVLSDGTGVDLSGLVDWSSTSAGVAGINAGGTATGLSAGDTTIQATRNGITGTAPLTVHATVADGVPPSVAITSPANDATLTGPVDVLGTANDANFLKYTLQIAPAGETVFTTIAEGDAPVVNGVLGQFDPTQLLNDLYTVVLTAFDKGGNTATTTRQFQVARDQKVGIFTLTFEDLKVGFAGLPIVISRVYDSRDKGSGDFGFGSRLEIQTMKARVNRVQGTGWQVIRSGGFIPSYSLSATDMHKVTITLPDGKVEEFDLRPTPSSQQLFPLQFITAAYAPRAGTLGTLVPLGSTSLIIVDPQPGPVTLLDDDTFVPYNPTSFQYTSVDGRVFVITTSTGVQSIREPNGNTLTLGPGGITHSSGGSVAFTRDGLGRITRITDPNGHFQQYAYDAQGNLSSHTDALGQRTRYLYNLDHGMLEIRDPRGIRPIRNEYDAEGRLVAHIDAAGNRVEYNHNVGARQQIVTDRLGFLTVYNYDADGNVLNKTDPLGNTTFYTYDARGNLLTETDPLGNVTTSTYDARNFLLTRTNPLGQTTSYTYNARGQQLTATDPAGNTTTFTYDARGNLLTETNPLGQVTANTYDAQGNLLTTTDTGGNTTSHVYDASGRRIRTTDALGHQTVYTYDANGNRLSESTTRTDFDGAVVPVVTRYEYDARDRLVRTIDAEVGVTSLEYDALGKLSAETDALGHRREYVYDSRGNRIETLHPDGTSETAFFDPEGRKVLQTDRGGALTEYEYDAVGRLTRTVLPDGATQELEYDPAGRVVGLIDELGRLTRREYDAAGRKIRSVDALDQVVAYTYDSRGNLTSTTDPKGQTLVFTYDALNRQTRRTYPDGTFVQTAYTPLGHQGSVTDQAGQVTQFEYDALGRLIRTTDALGGVTSHQYDEPGNRVVQTDALGRSTRWGYDNLNRLTRRTLPLGQTETFTYDAVGNPLARVDANGATTGFTHDSNRKLTGIAYPDGSNVAIAYTPAGQRSQVVDARGITTFAYDVRNRLLQVNPPDSGLLEYTYDAAGNRTLMTAPSGVTSYAYDDLNRLASVTGPDGGTSTYTYDPAGNRASVTLPNGARTTYTYDALNRLQTLASETAGGVPLASYTYTLGPAGNRLQVAEVGGRTVDYTYDALYRLVTEDISDPSTGARTFGYTYDAVGNRLSRADGAAVATYTYDGNDRLLDDGSATYTYDANGNRITRTTGGATTTYAYDSENRLIRTTGPGGVVETEYVYDADGNRVRSVSQGVISDYLVDTAQSLAQVVEERDSTGALKVRYTHGLDLLTQDRGGEIRHFLADGQNSTRQLLDPAQAVTDTYTYDAFGVELGRTGATVNQFLYTGQQFDPNVGFYYLRARYYDPAVGRFATPDQVEGNIFDPPSLHRYTYAHNNPVNRHDPSGRFLAGFAISIAIIGILAGIGYAIYRFVGFVRVEKITYEKFTDATRGGLTIKLGAKLKDRKPNYPEYRWVQFVTSNVPLGGAAANAPYNDPQPPDDAKPYYWTDAELPGKQNSGGYDLIFSDQPTRFKSSATAAFTVSWSADLALVGVSPAGGSSYTDLVKISYGFQLSTTGVTLSSLSIGSY
ncbi:MAG: PASTA domain-containing protein [Limisphaerales bacterium]